MPALIALINVVIFCLEIVIFARIAFSWIPGIQWYHPVVRTITTIADAILLPFRRVLPTFSGMDFSPIVALLALYELSRIFNDLYYSFIDVAISGKVFLAADLAAIVGELVLNIITIFAIIVLIRLVMGLFNASPWHPLVMGIRQISSPLVRPFQGMVSRNSTFDTASLLALIAYIALYVVTKWLFGLLVTQLGPHF